MPKSIPFQATEIKDIDWSRNSLCVGVELPPGERAPWLEFTREDLKMLQLLLTRQTPFEENGRIVYTQSAATVSEGLATLAGWAEGVMKWQDKQLNGSTGVDR